VNPKNFLPATRSMAFRKKVWRDIGKFQEQFSHNEDYVFAKALQKMHKKIVFAKQAIVYWYPPTNWKSSFIMFYRFAKGDAEARIFRPKVILLFLRYILSILLLLSFILFHYYFMFYILCFAFLLYLIWSIIKNYRYVKNLRALYFLPLLQVLSDSAVISGTIRGFTTNR